MDATVITAVLICVVILMLVSTSVADALRAKRAIKKRIADSWGKDPSLNYKSEDLQSIASYFLNHQREHGSILTIDDTSWNDLEFEDICHPLITEAVPNSMTISRPVLITGSNASGKSTFLKAVAINAILAQSIHTCKGREMPREAIFS